MTIFDPDNLVATLRPWLLGHLCPFWRERVVDPQGGFFENLDGCGDPIRERRRRTLVQARLTYVFSHAHVLSGEAAFKHAAEHGLEFLRRACRAGDDGWYRAVAIDGEVLDPARDAYDQGFVLLALAWHFRATGDAAAIDMADLTYAFVTDRLADARHGGFREECVPGRTGAKLPRRQNPHMHLLEALLALHVATADPIWLKRSEALVDLFKRRFVDRDTGALIEFFADDWSPAPGAPGNLREPGHQFEWVWLLFEFFRYSRDESVAPYAEQLYQFGVRFGIERETGLQDAVLDGVDAAGRLIADTKLLWPQTEFVKACAARSEWLQDEEALGAMRAHLALIARHYIRADGASWHNQLARDGAPIATVTPARVLYHLFMAAAEAERVLFSTTNT